MLNLSKRRRRPDKLVSIYTNVDTYYSHVCTFKKDKVTVVMTNKTWQKLQDIFVLYKKQVGGVTRWAYAAGSRLSLRAKDNSLEDSYLFHIFCNGFREAYKYFFYDITCFMTSVNAVENQIKAYRHCNRIQSLDFEPDEETCSMSDFRGYCFDLGQITAAEYALAKFKMLDQSFMKVDSLKDFLKLDSDSQKGHDYIQKYIDVGMGIIKANDKNRPKWTAAFIYFLNKNNDIKARVVEDKNTAVYNKEIISLMWKEVHADGVEVGNLKAKESFVKAVQRYLRRNDENARKIKDEDLQTFENQLKKHGLM